MAYDHQVARYRNLYAKLIRLYPRPYQEQFAESMQQTFADLCSERAESGRLGLGFVLWTFAETSAGIISEHARHDLMRTLASNPRLAALVGFLLLLPFFITNAIVANRLEPFFSLIRPGLHTSPQEYVLLVVLLLLILTGAFIAARPMLQAGADGKRKFYLANSVVAVLLFACFALLAFGLGSDIYRCDVLQIPNCD